MEKFRVSNSQLIEAFAGVIYRMHPYHKPENFDKIMDALLKRLDTKAETHKGKKLTFILLEYESINDFKKKLKEFLFEIKEFRQLNISKKLKDAGVENIDDERNSGIKFLTRLDVDTEDERYTDFVDLDACIQNIVFSVNRIIQFDENCFLCKYAKEYGSMKPGDSRCDTCICNPKVKYKRETHPMALKPRKDWTEEEKAKYSIW